MSSTNRGAKRIESDFYPTPLKSFNPLLPYLPKDKLIWEPAKGDGRLVRRMDEYGLKADGTDLSLGDDFLKSVGPWHCIVTNPPFSIAKSFVSHALEISQETFMLLRLNFLGAKERKEWWKKHEPSALFVLSERPNFVISVKCKSGRAVIKGLSQEFQKCDFKKFFSIEAKDLIPKKCPCCDGKLVRTSSDSTEYAWFYWGSRYSGIIHL